MLLHPRPRFLMLSYSLFYSFKVDDAKVRRFLHTLNKAFTDKSTIFTESQLFCLPLRKIAGLWRKY